MTTQLYFPLTQPVTTERGTSLVCIPDRITAENELTRLKHEHGPRLVKAIIRKDKPPKRWTTEERKQKATYTLRYFVRVTESVPLF
jgi:hypothetical protein